MREQKATQGSTPKRAGPLWGGCGGVYLVWGRRTFGAGTLVLLALTVSLLLIHALNEN